MPETLTAVEPFRFYARFALTLATGRRAQNLEELRRGVAESPDMVIYHHTHGFLSEHQSLVPEPSNDFALWVEDALQDKLLGERLGGVDTLRYSKLDDLRAAVLKVLDARIADGWTRAAPPGREFHFLSARRFSAPTGIQADSLAKFAEGVKKVGPSSLYLHLYEARLRPPLGVNDFSVWLERVMGEKALAKSVADLDLYRHTLEDVRRRVVSLVEERVQEKAHAKN